MRFLVGPSNLMMLKSPSVSSYPHMGRRGLIVLDGIEVDEQISNDYKCLRFES